MTKYGVRDELPLRFGDVTTQRCGGEGEGEWSDFQAGAASLLAPVLLKGARLLGFKLAQAACHCMPA